MRRCICDKMILKNAVPIVLIVVLILLSPVMSVSGAEYELSWSTIDGGGGTSIGGSYTLTGTIGQPNAGSASGGIYELLGGFWPGVSGDTTPITGDFCGEGSDQPDGYVDYWDLLYFAQRWHTRLGDPGWDSRCDLAEEDNYVDYWDLLVFAQQWHKGEPP